MKVSDSEPFFIVNEVKESLAEVAGRKRRHLSVGDSESEDYTEDSDEYEISSDEEMYIQFICDECKQMGEMGDIDSSDYEFMPSCAIRRF